MHALLSSLGFAAHHIAELKNAKARKLCFEATGRPVPLLFAFCVSEVAAWMRGKQYVKIETSPGR